MTFPQRQRHGEAILPLALLALEAVASPTCLHENVHYVNQTAWLPACCTADQYPSLELLVNRTLMGFSADSLLDEILAPDISHFQSSTVSSRPRFEKTQQIYAKVHVRRLYNVDQKAQQYTLLLDIHWTWRDCRLIFDKEAAVLDLHDKSSLYRDMWTPSVVFLEEAHSTETRSNEENVLIFGDGLVIMRQQLSRQLACAFDFSALPWDKQDCTVSVFMPGYPVHVVDLHWHPDEPLEMDTLSNGEWEISGYDEWKNSLREFQYKSLEPGPSRTLSALEMSFTLSRKPMDLISEYIMPTAVYWLSSYCGFWVDATAAPARVTLALIPILTLNNKMGQLRSQLPPINKSFRLGNFILYCFLLSTVHLLEFVVVHRCLHAKATKHDEESAPESAAAEEPRGVQRLKMRLEGWWLRFALWAKTRLDFWFRWLCPLMFLIIFIATLIA